MYIKKLFCTNTLKGTDGFSFSVDYFITEDSGIISDLVCPYGIFLKKSPYCDSRDVYSAERCFVNEDNAKLLISKLAEHSVTPVSAGDSIDILMESCDFKY